MKALIQIGYGSVEALEFAEVERPVPAADQVLVKVFATAINDWESSLLAVPWAVRPFVGLRKPRRRFRIPGCDVAGRIEAVGGRVVRFKPGDEVYGDLSDGFRFGAFAEYVCAGERSLVHKPAAMSFTQAAAIPHAAELALQALQAAPPLQPGHHVLVNGAGGGVGTLAIQLMKPHGVETTGVDRADKLELLRSLEYDHVIEYPKNDFTRLGKLYDLILDTKTSHSVRALTRVLRPGGAYITVGGDKLGSVVLFGAAVGRFTGKRLKVVRLKPNKNLVYISRLFESGSLAPVIDQVFEFTEIRAALSRFRRAEHRGKIVIEVARA